MAARSYGQYCGVTTGVELVTERWALLIIRDLLVGPRRYTDLKQGLPKIPTNILSARLKELLIGEEAASGPKGMKSGSKVTEALLAEYTPGQWRSIALRNDARMADIEALHTYEGTETIQTLIVGRDITGVGAFA